MSEATSGSPSFYSVSQHLAAAMQDNVVQIEFLTVRSLAAQDPLQSSTLIIEESARWGECLGTPVLIT